MKTVISQELLETLQQRFGDHMVGAEFEAIDPWIEVTPAGLLEICRYLHDDPALELDLLNCISGVDYFHTDQKKLAKASWEPHLSVVYHMSSTTKKHSLVLKVTLPRWKDGVEGELPELASVSRIWRTADWHEREVFDLMGVYFVGHADLRRILCPEDWVGHPLRKDYKPADSYHGIRDH